MIAQYLMKHFRTTKESSKDKRLLWYGLNYGQEKVSEKELETFGYALDQYISDNVPLMSKMKYLTFDISESFKKMSDSLFELNKLMSTVLKNQQKLNQTINLNDKYKVDDMILKLKSGLDGWSTWCLVNKNLVNDHFSHYLHFRKHELMALKEVEQYLTLACYNEANLN